jgi:FolB domain-containing protein
LARVTHRDVLAVSGIETECVVGVYPHERNRLQPLRVDLDLFVDTEHAAKSAKLSRTVDYDRMTSEIVFLLKSCRFGLIETAAGALASYVLAPPGPGEQRAHVMGVRLKLIKPQALPRGAEASLEIRREREWVRITEETTSFGNVEVLFESREASIFRVNLAPNQETAMHRETRAHEAEMVLTEGLVEDALPRLKGSARRFAVGTPRVYANPTAHWQSILCVHSPISANESVSTGVIDAH